MNQKAICPNSGHKNAVIYVLFSDWIQSGPTLDTVNIRMQKSSVRETLENRLVGAIRRWDGS
jgi:hypothetical protein